MGTVIVWNVLDIFNISKEEQNWLDVSRLTTGWCGNYLVTILVKKNHPSA